MKLVLLWILLTNRIPISDNWIKDVVQESSGDPGLEYLVEIQKLVNALCEQVTFSASQKMVSYFLLLGNFRFFLFSSDPKRMQSLERTHQHEQAEPSSHQKSWRLLAVFGRLEYSTGRYIQQNRAGCTTGASIAPPRRSCEGKRRKQHLNNELTAIWVTFISEECEPLDNVNEAPVSKGFLSATKWNQESKEWSQDRS